ncbi:unnamed protein product [Echinostoma caproni]|uniref:HYPK_UBA domain-containing protein n=1 Tax=Echinostoma caproni TaxID=27848 RepID=A0A183A0U9_9TREM|nr:unnamed protein product [Echinostoma caproni]
MGPSTEPCGTPIESGEGEETDVLIRTAKERFDGKLSDELMVDMDKTLLHAEMLGITQEQALELEKPKAKVNAVGDQVAKLSALMLNSSVHSRRAKQSKSPSSKYLILQECYISRAP